MMMVPSFPEILDSGRRLLVVFNSSEEEFVADMKNVLGILDQASDVM